MAAGRAGGTVIVIRLSELSIRLAVEVPILIMIGSVQQKPTMEIRAMIATNFMLS
jgi:hypothetical protein